MPRDFLRRDRVGEELKRELSLLITTQVKDPRVRLAAITEVDVSPDLKYAKVYVGTFDVTAATENPGEVIAGLRAASGFLKRELGKRLRLRSMPELRFAEDATEREAQRLSSLIDSAVAEDRLHDNDSDGANPDEREDHGPT